MGYTKTCFGIVKATWHVAKCFPILIYTISSPCSFSTLSHLPDGSFIYVVFFGTCEKRDTFCLGGDGKYSKIEFSHARIFVLLNHRLFITCTLLLCQQFCTSLKGPVHLHPFLIFIHFCFSLVHTLSLSHTYTQSLHVLLSSLFFFYHVFCIPIILYAEQGSTYCKCAVSLLWVGCI